MCNLVTVPLESCGLRASVLQGFLFFALFWAEPDIRETLIDSKCLISKPPVKRLPINSLSAIARKAACCAGAVDEVFQIR